MNKIGEPVLKPLRESIYLKPYSIEYTQKGRTTTINTAKQHDSVAIIIYNTTRNVLVFVKQFRPPIYISSIPETDRNNIDVKKYPAETGVTIELCAGIVDKNLSLVDTAREEVLEECGYDVPSSQLEEVISYNGIGCTLTTYYCEVTDSMKVCRGGGVDDEVIEVAEMTVEDMKKYLSQDHVLSPPSFMYCMYWFLYNKVKV